MKSYTLLLLSILTVFTSCHGQNQKTVDIKAEQINETPIGDTVSELDKTIFIVFQANNNDYWFGSDGQGVFRYDGKTILHFATKDGLCNNRIREIKEDKSGNIFFTTLEGISKFDGQKFTTLPVIKSNEWKLEPDDLWFTGAQDSGVVYRYDGKLLYRLEFPKTQEGDEHISKFPRSKFPNVNYSPYDVYIIYNDNIGNVWFGTSSLGVCRYDGKSFMWISESDLEFDVNTGFGIRSILEDNDGNFWFSNTLFSYNFYGHINATNYRKEKGIGSLDGKKDGDLVAIMSMVKGNNGEIWMATYNSGVWSYDGKKITHYPVNIDDKSITIFYIYKDNQGDLWLGTHEEGAYKFNGDQFEKFTP
jgi:ligand-binding sensor domain-containing protein